MTTTNDPGLAAALGDPAFCDLLTGSYRRLVGKALTDRDAAWLYRDAPFVVLAHNTDPDPVFTYANRAAQDCFGYGWDEFLTLPSRLSAEPMLRQDRQLLLDSVRDKGFIADYRGIRIAKSGRRFMIGNAVVWQLIDEAGAVRGQAATFAEWADV
jgi:PAS domain-containing protein